MPSTISKTSLPTAEELRRTEAVLAGGLSELEELHLALRHPQAVSEAAYTAARAEGATADDAIARAAAVEAAARPVVDDEVAGRLLIFLLDVIDQAKAIDRVAHECLEVVKSARHEHDEPSKG